MHANSSHGTSYNCAVRGPSQEGLAREAQLHRTFVSHVERKVRNVSLDNVEALARALKVPVADLFAVPKLK